MCIHMYLLGRRMQSAYKVAVFLSVIALILFIFTESLKTMLSGGLAGCAMWTVAFPLDAIKSRIQVCCLSVAHECYVQKGL